ncbi:hypothetical protein [uncultured Mediterranean phage uvMED]|nr:hypothetical protein [uncultured Mediterranean phage uvMED]
MADFDEIRKAIGPQAKGLDNAAAALVFWKLNQKKHKLPLGMFADKLEIDKKTFSEMVDIAGRAGVELTARSVDPNLSDSEGQAMKAARSAFQGATFNFGDEITAAGAAALKKLADPDTDFLKSYDRIVEQERRKVRDFEEQNPALDFAGTVAGAVAAPVGLASALIKGPAIARTTGAAAAGGLEAFASELGEGQGSAVERAREVDPFAPLVGILLGGSLQSAAEIANSAFAKFFKNRAAKKAGKGARSIEDLRKEADALYLSARDQGLEVSPEAYQQFVESVLRDRKLQQFSSKAGRKLAPKASALLDLMEENIGKALGFNDLEVIRQNAVRMRGGDQDAFVAREVTDFIDDFIDNLKPSQLTKGNAEAIGPIIKRARQFWTTMKKSEVVQNALEKADRSASGFENGIRNEMRSILNNKKKAASFSKAEKEIMEEIVKGSFMGNLYRRIGRFGFGRGPQTTMLGSSVAAGAGAAAGGPLGALAAVGAGQIGQFLAERTTQQKAELLRDLISSGGIDQFKSQFGERPLRLLIDAANQLGQRSVREVAPNVAENVPDELRVLELPFDLGTIDVRQNKK